MKGFCLFVCLVFFPVLWWWFFFFFWFLFLKIVGLTGGCAVMDCSNAVYAMG